VHLFFFAFKAVFSVDKRSYERREHLERLQRDIRRSVVNAAKSREAKEQNARLQDLNRSILQILYAGALQIQEPVKKAGVIYRSDDQGETWTRRTAPSGTGWMWRSARGSGPLSNREGR